MLEKPWVGRGGGTVAGKGILGRLFLASSSFLCFAVFLVYTKVPVPALKTLNFLPPMTVSFWAARERAWVTLAASANSTKQNLFSPFLLGYFLPLRTLKSRMMPHLQVFSKNCLRLPMLIWLMGCTQIVRSVFSWSRYFTRSSTSIEILDLLLLWSSFSLKMHSSLVRLFLRNSSSSLLLLPSIFPTPYRMLSLVRKLNLSPRIFRLLLSLAIRLLTMDSNPLSLILLCPSSRNSRVGWKRTTFSAIDLAPSQPILLLKTFRNLRLLLFLRDLASSSAPETPMLFLLRSSTSMRLLQGRTPASIFMPSLSRLFLERSKTLIWHLLSRRSSRASTRMSAMFFCRPADLMCRVLRRGLSARILTYSGSFLLSSLLQLARAKLGLRLAQQSSCRALRLLQKTLLQLPAIILASLLGSPYHCSSSYSLTRIPSYRQFTVFWLLMVPVRSRNYRHPFFFALKATELPSSFILELRSPLFERSSALKLLHSPKAIQNSLVSALFKPAILLSLRISMLALILSILQRETTVSLMLLEVPLASTEISPRSRRTRLGLKAKLQTIEASPCPSPFWVFILKILSFFILMRASARILHFSWSSEHLLSSISSRSLMLMRMLLRTFMALPWARRLVLEKRRERRESVAARQLKRYSEKSWLTMMLLKEMMSSLPLASQKLLRPFLMALAALASILLLSWGSPENSMYLRVVSLLRMAVMQQQPDLRFFTSTTGMRMVLMLFWAHTNSFWQKVEKSGFMSMYFRKSSRSSLRNSRFQSMPGMPTRGSSYFVCEFLQFSFMILLTWSSVLDTPFFVPSRAFREMSEEEREGSDSMASLTQDQRSMHMARQSASWLTSSLQSKAKLPSSSFLTATWMNLWQEGMSAQSLRNCSSLGGSLLDCTSTLLCDFLRSEFTASSHFATSCLLWYSLRSEFFIASLSRRVTSESERGLRPMQRKQSWKFWMFLEMLKISACRKFSSLLLSLQRLASYCSSICSAEARRCLTWVRKSLQKQKRCSPLIWHLNTTWVRTLSACSSRESLSSSGTDFRIQQTWRSSCSWKQASATSSNLKSSITVRYTSTQARLGTAFLCLPSSDSRKPLTMSRMRSRRWGKRRRAQRKMEWMWVRVRMMRMEACFFSSMIWKVRLRKSLGSTSRMNSGLKFLVELVITIEKAFFRKWKNRSSLSPLPKYTGSQCVTFSLLEVRFIDSLMKALIEMQSKKVSPSLISPLRGIFEMLSPRPSWFCSQPSLVWKQISSFRMMSFSSSMVSNSSITASLLLKGGQSESLPPCLQPPHLQELASFTAFLMLSSTASLFADRFSSKRKLCSWVSTLWTLQAEVHPTPSSVLPSVCCRMSRQMQPPKTLGWGMLLKMRMVGGWLGQLFGNFSSRWNTPPSQSVFSGPRMLACQVSRSFSRGRAVTPTVGIFSLSISARSLMSLFWQRVTSFSLMGVRRSALSMCLPGLFIKYLNDQQKNKGINQQKGQPISSAHQKEISLGWPSTCDPPVPFFSLLPPKFTTPFSPSYSWFSFLSPSSSNLITPNDLQDNRVLPSPSLLLSPWIFSVGFGGRKCFASQILSRLIPDSRLIEMPLLLLECNDRNSLSNPSFSLGRSILRATVPCRTRMPFLLGGGRPFIPKKYLQASRSISQYHPSNSNTQNQLIEITQR